MRGLLVSSWLAAWLVVLSAAVLLTLLVSLDALPDESALVRDVQAWSFPGQTLSDAVRALTSTEFVIVAGLGIAAFHWLSRDRKPAAVLVVLLIVLPLTQTGIKQLVDRPRPPEVDSSIEARASYSSPSYPAGHVMSPAVVYGWALFWLFRPGVPRMRMPGAQRNATWLRTARWPAAFLLAFVLLLTGLVNVHLGVHWPTDAIGGYLWAAALLLPAVAACGRLN